jgi:hypothetical protein
MPEPPFATPPPGDGERFGAAVGTASARQPARRSRELPPFAALVFFAALVTFWWVIPFGDLDTIIGDNIAQVAYFRVLFRPSLAGSIGASSMKPALILLLGGAHELSLLLFHSTALIKLVFAASAAGLVTIVARIAKDAGGPLAGAVAALYLVTLTPVPEMFTAGSSMIVYLPLLFWGLWLWSRGHERAGAVVLCLSALTRIESLMVLAWLCAAEQLLRRNWRGVVFTGLATALTIVFTALVYYRVQGSVERFNAGGPAVGYIFSSDPSVLHRLKGSLAFTLTASYRMLAERCGPPSFIVPALGGVLVARSRRVYAGLLGVPLFLNVYFANASGSPELRYFEFLVPAGASFGAAGLVAALEFGRTAPAGARRLAAGLLALLTVAAFALGARQVGYSALLPLGALAFGALDVFALTRLSPRLAPILLCVLLAASATAGVRCGEWSHRPKRAVYTADAKALLSSQRLPRHARVLTEDDVIYGVIVRDGGFFKHATALQYFNIQDEATRVKILDKTDYIAVSCRNHGWYYLRYDPQRRGDSDPFRAAVGRNATARVYGRRLKLVDSTPAFRLFKVQHGRS